LDVVYFSAIEGLGYREMAKRYAITDLPEAAPYLAHLTLCARLIEIAKALLALPGNNANVVMGSPDDLKLRSSMTLFSLVPGADAVFKQCLRNFSMEKWTRQPCSCYKATGKAITFRIYLSIERHFIALKYDSIL
jgi:uncharacterized protein (DUF1810 family)